MTATRLNTKSWSREEWLQHRTKGIGGSDVGTILGLNPYKSASQLFVEKLRLFPSGDADNVAAFMGDYMEDRVADLWTYYHADELEFIKNAKTGNKTGKCHRVNAMLTNEKYPWLRGNIDRKITELNGEKINGVLECKTINGFYAKQFEDGIPPQYYYQLQTYLLITGYSFGQIALLVDGRNLVVEHFDADEQMQQEIIEKTKQFWDAIEQAQPIAEKVLQEEIKETKDFDLLDSLSAQLSELEPNCDASKSYEDYMKQRYPDPEGIRKGTDEELEIAARYSNLQKQQSQLKSEIQETKNRIIERIRDKEMIEFDNGKVTYKADSRGRKSLRVRINNVG